MNTPLPRSFYDRSALQVAHDLLGTRLVQVQADGTRLAGIIVETEAYTGLTDLASHGRHKPTPRNQPMWGPPGHAYVYLSRGIHWMLNVVAESAGAPAGVLIRAVHPVEGLETFAARRPGRSQREWTSGPGRLAVAFNISKAHNSLDMTTRHSGLWIEAGETISESRVRTSARIGMGKTPEPWYSIPWRWYVADDEYVSHERSSGERRSTLRQSPVDPP